MIVVAIDGVRWQEVFEGVERSMAEAEAIPEAFILPPHRLLPNLRMRIGAGTRLRREAMEHGIWTRANPAG